MTTTAIEIINERAINKKGEFFGSRSISSPEIDAMKESTFKQMIGIVIEKASIITSKTLSSFNMRGLKYQIDKRPGESEHEKRMEKNTNSLGFVSLMVSSSSVMYFMGYP